MPCCDEWTDVRPAACPCCGRAIDYDRLTPDPDCPLTADVVSAQTADWEWFRTHPGVKEYLRPLRPGEQLWCFLDEGQPFTDVRVTVRRSPKVRGPYLDHEPV